MHKHKLSETSVFRCSVIHYLLQQLSGILGFVFSYIVAILTNQKPETTVINTNLGVEYDFLPLFIKIYYGTPVWPANRIRKSRNRISNHMKLWCVKTLKSKGAYNKKRCIDTISLKFIQDTVALRVIRNLVKDRIQIRHI